MNSRTVGGLMTYCDWLKDKGYAGASAADAWKSAAKVVFETVDGESYESLSLDGIDLDDYVLRFQRLGGTKYRIETVNRYKNRIRNAMDAQAYFIEHGKQPELRRGTPKPKAEGEDQKQHRNPATKRAQSTQSTPSNVSELPAPDFFEFTYPLSPGRMVRMQLPMQMSKREIDRLSAVLQTLEEQPQLPPGDAQAVAA